MKTNLLRSLIALMLVVALLPLTGIAALAAEKPKLVMETDSMKGEADNDKLFAQYVENLFYKDVDGYTPPYSTGSHTAGSKLTGGAKVAYNELVPFIKKVAAGQSVSTNYTFSNRVAVPASEYSEHVRLVISALLFDYPYEMYWFDKTAGWSYGTRTESDQRIIANIGFSVASAYSAGSFQMNTAKASAPAKAVANAKSIVSSNAGKSDRDKLEAYKRAISDRVDYNYDALNAGTPYGDPWQMLWIFDGDNSTKVVCEGYAKGFQYLCDSSTWSGNVQCYSVTGRTSGGHMWNILSLNGSKYLVDITNCDTGTNGSYDDRYFLQFPTSGSVADGYTYPSGLKYTYDSNTIESWGTSVLTMGAPKGVTITSQPQSVTVAKGAVATVTIGASGDGLSYTWYVKTPDSSSFIKSAVTGKTYSVTMSAARNGTQLYCVVKDEYGNSVKSNTVTISMKATPLTITSQPQSVTVAKGAEASVSISATGDGLSYAWYVKTPDSSSFTKSAVTGKTYAITMSAARNGTQLYCVVSDSHGNTVKSNTVTIKMKAAALAITSQPQSVTVAKGAVATVTVGATGDGLSYAWYVKTPDSSSFTKSAVTGKTYSVTMSAARNGTQLYCVVSDSHGNSVRSNTVTIKMKATPLTITKQPQSVTVAKGATAKVTISATGDGVTYAWYVKAVGKSSFSKSAVTGNTYSVEMTAARSGNQLYCLVKDKYGNSVKSNTVTIKMKATPLTITKQPQSVTVAKGATAKVTISATGDGVTYAWYVKAVGKSSFSKSAVTGNTYSVEMTAARSGNQLYCLVKDKYGNSVKSNTVTIKMKATPLTITKQPQSVTVAKGATAKVTISATGDGVTYAWYVKAVGKSSFSKSAVTGNTYSVEMTAARSGNQLYCIVKDKYGNSVKSNTVTIKMKATPLTITKQPQSVTVAKGATAKVTISATGDGVTYAWYVKAVGKSSFSKSAVTGNTYSVEMTAARSGNQLYCLVKDKYGNSVKSNTVTIKMKATTLAITTQPQSVTVASGATAKLTVGATGDGLTYAWYLKAVGKSTFSKSSITGNTYSVTMTAARNGNQLYCVVKDKYGNSVKSNTVTIKMKAPITITTQPKSVTAAKGATATLTISATGEGLTYVWYVKPAGSSSFSRSTVTGKTYSVTMTAARNGNQLYCLVKDQKGNSVKSNTVTIKLPDPVVITTQPRSVTVARGATAKLTVGAKGDGLTYAWYLKAVGKTSFSKSTATGSTYSVTMTDARNGNQLYCVVKDQYGNTAKSNTVTIKQEPITITTQPQSVTVANGAAARVSVSAVGSGLTYTWYVKLPGKTSYTKSAVTGRAYAITMTAARNGTELYCVVQDQYGNTKATSTVMLKMTGSTAYASEIATAGMLAIENADPQTVNVNEGGMHTMSITATGGTMPYSYQWYVNKGRGYEAVEGATNATYTTSPADHTSSGYSYYCIVTDGSGNTVTGPVYTVLVAGEAAAPATGDNSLVELWAVLCIISAGACLMLMKRRKSEK